MVIFFGAAILSRYNHDSFVSNPPQASKVNTNTSAGVDEIKSAITDLKPLVTELRHIKSHVEGGVTFREYTSMISDLNGIDLSNISSLTFSDSEIQLQWNQLIDAADNAKRGYNLAIQEYRNIKNAEALDGGDFGIGEQTKRRLQSTWSEAGSEVDKLSSRFERLNH